jgi:hypothetical protein
MLPPVSAAQESLDANRDRGAGDNGDAVDVGHTPCGVEHRNREQSCETPCKT